MLLSLVSEHLPFCVSQLVLFHLVPCFFFLEPINSAKWGVPVLLITYLRNKINSNINRNLQPVLKLQSMNL
jgi:hypothetical protein